MNPAASDFKPNSRKSSASEESKTITSAPKKTTTPKKSQHTLPPKPKHVPGTKVAPSHKMAQSPPQQTFTFTFKGLEDYDIPIPAFIRKHNPQKENVVLLAVGVLVFVDVPVTSAAAGHLQAEQKGISKKIGNGEESIANVTDRLGDVSLQPSIQSNTKTANSTEQSTIETVKKLLLIRRAPTDSMPLLWETPGGGCDSTDASVLHSAARELLEESGLDARSIIAPVGGPWFFSTRRTAVKKIMKMNFIVEGGCNPSTTSEDGKALRSGTHTPEDLIKAVKLDPKEHCEFVWASEEEVKQGVVLGADEGGGEKEIWFTSKEQWGVCLQGFEVLREREMEMGHLGDSGEM